MGRHHRDTWIRINSLSSTTVLSSRDMATMLKRTVVVVAMRKVSALDMGLEGNRALSCTGALWLRPAMTKRHHGYCWSSSKCNFFEAHACRVIRVIFVFAKLRGRPNEFTMFFAIASSLFPPHLVSPGLYRDSSVHIGSPSS